MRSSVLVSAARTPFGGFGRTLRDMKAIQLGAVAIRAALDRAGVNPGDVDYLLMGMVVQAGAGQIPSRQAGIAAGLPVTVPSDTINKVCASGLRAVNIADMMIRAGEAEVVVAGGMESMSQAPYLMDKARWGALRLGHGTLIDGVIRDGLWCPFGDVHMGAIGDACAKKHGITREEQDRWALRSHQRALAAIREGRLRDEIVPVEIPQKDTSPLIFDSDEAPRPDTSLEKLARLRPAFSPDGTITPGNAPGLNDGAGALVVMQEAKAKALGIRPLARIVSHGAASVDPADMPEVPAVAAKVALDKAGLSIRDIGLIEVNEAFAAVALISMRLGGWNEDMVNVNGGAIALGHPIGASGARILMTLVFEMRRRGARFGLATICSGAAQGEATIVELCER
ncbi:MAG: acetyl-CoA C-acetyltransferase [Bacillota bacterium]|nr:acetyl-CoA C-acetyltransferase [Bacillota bacterium]